jgi:hypothetical protein
MGPVRDEYVDEYLGHGVSARDHRMQSGAHRTDDQKVATSEVCGRFAGISCAQLYFMVPNCNGRPSASY